jgi:DNA-binding transcriptional MocR family regulator
VLREVLDGGKYKRHIERLRDRVAKARASAAQLLTTSGLTVEGAGAEGIFLWSRLPPHVDAERLSLDAQAQGILLAKGALFSPTGQFNDCLRFNVAYAADPALIQFLSSRTARQTI